MRRIRFALKGSLYTVLALALCLAPLGRSGGMRSAHADREKDKEIEINIGSEEVPIEDFLRALSRATDTHLVWNPQDKNIRGKKIIGGVNLKARADEFFALARGLLTFYELVMIPVGPKDNQVVLVMDARATSSILKLKPEAVTLTPENLSKYEHADGLFITCAIQMKHMQDLRNARNALTRIVTGQNIGNVTEVPAAKIFVVTDFAPNVVSIYRLLMKMDTPSASGSTTTGQTEAVVLEYAVAADMAAVLQQHFAAAPKAARNPRAPVVQGPSAPRVTADARTNMILITGTEEQITKVKTVIARLDVGIHRADTRAHYVRLKHIDAQEAAGTLMSFVQESTGLWPKENRPSVVAHDENNALLISATRTGTEELLRLIREMDVAPKPKAEDK